MMMISAMSSVDPPMRGRLPTRKRTCSFSVPATAKFPRTSAATSSITLRTTYPSPPATSVANAHPAASYFPGTYAHPAAQQLPLPTPPHLAAASHRSRSRKQVVAARSLMTAIVEEHPTPSAPTPTPTPTARRRSPSPDSPSTTAASTITPAPLLSSRIRPPTPRLSSPLCPVTPRKLSFRPGLPRSKPHQPPLYKLALRTAHARTSHGATIKAVGAHLALDILRAEEEYENALSARKLVESVTPWPTRAGDCGDNDGDVLMRDESISVGSSIELQASWVEVLGLGEDWEKEAEENDATTTADWQLISPVRPFERSPTPIPSPLPSPRLVSQKRQGDYSWPCGVAVSV